MRWLEVETERGALASLLRLVSASAANSQGPGHALPLTINLTQGAQGMPPAVFPLRARDGKRTACRETGTTTPHGCARTHTHTPDSKVAPCAS